MIKFSDNILHEGGGEGGAIDLLTLDVHDEGSWKKLLPILLLNNEIARSTLILIYGVNG